MNDNTMDKISIYVPRGIYDMIINDMHMFEIFNKDGTGVVKSRFLNMLVQGYHDTYVEENYRTREKIVSTLRASSIPDPDCETIATKLMEEVIRPGGQRGGKGSKPLPLKPTGKTVDLIRQFIDQPDDYISQYFRRMLISYCSKPFPKREQLVFRENYELLSQCCKNHRPICFSTTRTPGVLHEVVPFVVTTGAEEMYNFLLCQERNRETQRLEARAYAIRIINQITMSRKAITLDPEVKRHLIMMQEKGPQYAINDDEEICVRLTEKGREIYKRVYFGKPKHERIEQREDGYYYYYQCSKDQVLMYYKRFDPKTVEIMAPESLRNQMRLFFYSGVETYS